MASGDSQTRPKLLLLGEIEHKKSLAAWQSLSSISSPTNNGSEGFELLTPNAQNPAEFLEECRGNRFQGVVAAFSTFSSSKIVGRMEGEVVKLLKEKGLRYLCHCGAGYDQLSIPSLSDSHILVSNTPTAVDASTSDTALFLLLACIRNFGAAQLALRSGTFKGQPPPALGHDPEGKTVGILGMGGIGRAFKRRVEPLGMNVIYHNRKPLPDDQAEGASYVSFDDLLHKCDILFVSLPLNPATRHILSHTALSQLKPGAIIINTARGPIIDESAMVELIKSGHIRSVGLDVYENEPSVHPELIRMEKEEGKVVLLPHMGTYTQETQEKMELLCVANVVAGVMWPGRYEYEGGEDVIKGTNAGDGKKGERAVGEEFVTGRIVEQKDQMEI